MLRLSFELLLLNLSLDFFLPLFLFSEFELKKFLLSLKSLTHSVVLNSLSVLLLIFLLAETVIYLFRPCLLASEIQPFC